MRDWSVSSVSDPGGEDLPPIVFELIGGAYAHGVSAGVRKYARSRLDTWRVVPKAVGVEDFSRRVHAHGVVAQVIDPARFPYYKSLGCPVVNVADNHDEFELPTVISDNRAIGRMAAEYLISQGYRHLGVYLVGIPWYAVQRREGFEEAAREAGCKVTIIHGAPSPGRFAVIEERLRAVRRPIAVLACHDAWAMEVVNKALRMGLRVPEDVAVLGVDDDVALCETSPVPISSVAVNAERVGYEAAALLDRLLQGEPAPAEPIEIPPLRVVVRESTDVGSAGDPTVARALRLITDSADEPLTVDKLADAINVSRRTLEQRFRRVLGRGPAEELRRQRIERAKVLLQETNHKVIDVALRSGFSGAPQFSAAFRLATGVSPSAYRRLQRSTSGADS